MRPRSLPVNRCRVIRLSVVPTNRVTETRIARTVYTVARSLVSVTRAVDQMEIVQRVNTAIPTSSAPREADVTTRCVVSAHTTSTAVQGSFAMKIPVNRNVGWVDCAHGVESVFADTVTLDDATSAPTMATVKVMEFANITSVALSGNPTRGVCPMIGASAERARPSLRRITAKGFDIVAMAVDSGTHG